MAAFEVRRDRKVVVDEEADLSHTVRQEAKNPPSLVRLPAPIREQHVYPGRPAFIPSGGCCFAPISAQVVVPIAVPVIDKLHYQPHFARHRVEPPVSCA